MRRCGWGRSRLCLGPQSFLTLSRWCGAGWRKSEVAGRGQKSPSVRHYIRADTDIAYIARTCLVSLTSYFPADGRWCLCMVAFGTAIRARWRGAYPTHARTIGFRNSNAQWSGIKPRSLHWLIWDGKCWWFGNAKRRISNRCLSDLRNFFDDSCGPIRPERVHLRRSCCVPVPF